MASSHGRDKDSDSSNSQAGNPFIKFKQFADAQIGSLLQGVIGLPSAFSRTSPGSSRWADFDDDLRRRDELQAKQRDLRESESRRQDRSVTEADSDIPVKRSGGHKPSTILGLDPKMPSSQALGERDVPFYSPITKSLFTHLKRGDGRGDWEELDPAQDRSHALFSTMLLGVPLSAEVETTNHPLLKLQHLIFNTLQYSPLFARSDSSLIPYLLFSSYSPLKLCEAKQLPFCRRTSQTPLSAFPYRDAFEDLLLASQRRPMNNWRRNVPFQMTLADGSAHQHASDDMNWILYRLSLNGLLEPKETRGSPEALSKSLETSSQHLSSQEQPPTAKSDPGLSKDLDDGQTEQDMYQHFLHWASSPTAIAGTIESLFADTESFIQEQMKTFEKSSTKTNSGGRLESLPRAASVSTPDKDRVVFTSTTSDHTRHEDGTVETSVTVRKRFADGRETETTTTHVEEPSLNENDHGINEMSVENPPPKDDQKTKGHGAKAGWFWT